MKIRDMSKCMRLVRAWAADSPLVEQDKILTDHSNRHSSGESRLQSGKPDRSPRPLQPVSKEKTLPKMKNPDHDRETVLRLIRRIKEQQA